MPSPTITHLICTTALITLIFTMQFFYFIVIENVQTETITRELKEVADHVSATFTNLYLMLNSSDLNFNLTKKLDIPDSVHNRAYTIEILHDDENVALSIRVKLRDEPSVHQESPLVSGLKVDSSTYLSLVVEGRSRDLFANCRRVGGEVRIGFKLSD